MLISFTFLPAEFMLSQKMSNLELNGFTSIDLSYAAIGPGDEIIGFFYIVLGARIYGLVFHLEPIDEEHLVERNAYPGDHVKRLVKSLLYRVEKGPPSLFCERVVQFPACCPRPSPEHTTNPHPFNVVQNRAITSVSS